MSKAKHLIVLSAPSGGGKSTVARHLKKKFPQLGFSISATTRKPRPKERHGREYFFISREEFEKKIAERKFVEYEEIYGNYYGTLNETIEAAIFSGKYLLFDIDVKGALSLKKVFPTETLLIFLKPPDIAVLEERLLRRGSENEKEIKKRMERVRMEMEMLDEFDHVVVNDILEETLKTVEEIARKNIK